MRELVTTAFEVAGLLALTVAAAIGAYDVAGPAASAAVAGVALVAESLLLERVG